MREKWKIVSGSTLKLIGIGAMFLDHFALAVVRRMLWTAPFGQPLEDLRRVYSLLRSVGRLGFPIFCFLLVEGFGKTKSRPKYLLRLGLFALISEVPYDLVFSARVLEFGHQNVYFTLFLGLFALCGYLWLKEHPLPAPARWPAWVMGVAAAGAWLTKTGWHFAKTRLLSQLPALAGSVTATTLCLAVCGFVAILLLCYGRFRGWSEMLDLGTDLALLFLLTFLADLLRTDYLGVGVLTISAMYLLRRHPPASMAGGCGVLMLKGLRELSAFWALLPAALYNGKRGLKLKYVFYIFYPAHLLLLWLVARYMGTTHLPVF